MNRPVLRSFAGQFLIYARPVEADDPAASDLDHRHARLTGLANDVARSLWVAFHVDLLERNLAVFEITLCPTTPRASGRAEQHYLGHQTTSFTIPLVILIIR